MVLWDTYHHRVETFRLAVCVAPAGNSKDTLGKRTKSFIDQDQAQPGFCK